MRFEWDPRKDASNQRKHGVSFAEASALFEGDANYLEIYDERSTVEDRFIAIGPIRRGVVVVVWTERTGDVVRLISARFATANERRLLDDHWRRR